MNYITKIKIPGGDGWMSGDRAPMKSGLIIPSYVDAFFPEVGIATLQLLERSGCLVEYPLNQTCYGQPMTNSGCQEDSAATEALFVDCFEDFDTVVG
jgi:L-lactate dehydrogenase complex protein LldE